MVTDEKKRVGDATNDADSATCQGKTWSKSSDQQDLGKIDDRQIESVWMYYEYSQNRQILRGAKV